MRPTGVLSGMPAFRSIGAALVAASLVSLQPLAASAQQTAAMPLPYLAGATPEPAASPCAGENVPRTLVIAPHAVLTAASVANYHAHSSSPYAVVLITIRYDGVSGELIPPTPDIDAAMRTSLANLARTMTIKPIIAGCGRFAKFLIARINVDDGSVIAEELRLPLTRCRPRCRCRHQARRRRPLNNACRVRISRTS